NDSPNSLQSTNNYKHLPNTHAVQAHIPCPVTLLTLSHCCFHSSLPALSRPRAAILNLKFAVIRRCRARTTRKSLPLSHSPRTAPRAPPPSHSLASSPRRPRAHTRTIVSTRSSLVAPDIAGAALPLPPPPKTQKNIRSRKTDAFILCNKYVNYQRPLKVYVYPEFICF